MEMESTEGGKDMKRLLAFIVVLCLLIPCRSYAEMKGIGFIDKIDTRNRFLYATIDKATGCMYFWLPGKLGFSHIYQYNPDHGWKLLHNPWCSEVKSMVVSDGVLYYTLYGQLDASGRVAHLYALFLRKGYISHLLRHERVVDILAAGDGKVLVDLCGYKDGQQPDGYYFYDLYTKQFTELDVSGCNRITFMENGFALGKPDDTWAYYDYSTEDISFEISFSTQNFADIYSPRYWTEQLMGKFDTLVYLDGEMIYQIAGYDGITKNDRYVIWYKAPRGRQVIYALDVYASEDAPQIAEYEVNVLSNIYLLDHYAVMLSDEAANALTMIDLETGVVSRIAPP